MASQLHPIFRQVLAPFAPAQSDIHLTAEQRQRIDAEMHADKLANGPAHRAFLTSMEAQINRAAGSPL